jgi:KaiC/GvpD/RAD55 family RecA-like ATPase
MRIEINDHSEYDQERLFLCQLITNTQLLKEVYTQFDPDLLSSEYSQIIGKWIKQHYKETQSAPGKDLQTIFSRRSGEIQDKDVVKNISILLKSLSEDWGKYRIVNTTYNAREIINYLDEQNARRLKENIETAIDIGDFKRVPLLASQYQKIQVISASGESIFQNPGKYTDAFHEEDQRLFTLQGALGRTVGWFRRGEFSAIAARTKGGKSYLKWYCARRGAAASLKVIYFNLEINKKMFDRRVFQDLMAMPKVDKEVRIGYFDEDGDIDYRYEERKGPGNLTATDIEKKLQKAWTLYKGDVYPITYPRGKVTVTDMRNDVKRLWEYHGYQADCIIIDYMDIVASDTHHKDKFEIENAIWEATAAWAAEDDVGIISSTQANLDGFDGKSFGAKGVGGVYKKLAHPDKLIAMFSGELDEEQSVVRVKQLYDRDATPSHRECVVITGMDIGRFYMDSRMADDVNNLESKRRKRKK